MENNKVYDLKNELTYLQKNKTCYSKTFKTISNIEDGKQLVRSSGSIAANYIEANEKLGDKDFKFRLKIARKEAKESVLWLKLLIDLNPNHELELTSLLGEVEELRKILSAIINKS